MLGGSFSNNSVEASALVVKTCEGITNIMQVTEETLIDLIKDLKNPPEDNLGFIKMFENAMMSFEEVANCTFIGRTEYLTLIRRNYTDYLRSLVEHFAELLENYDPNNPKNDSKIIQNNSPRGQSLIKRVIVYPNQYSFFNIDSGGSEEITISEIGDNYLYDKVLIEFRDVAQDHTAAQSLWGCIYYTYATIRNRAVGYANQINKVAQWSEGMDDDDY
jgi:hypothetical protein